MKSKGDFKLFKLKINMEEIMTKKPPITIAEAQEMFLEAFLLGPTKAEETLNQVGKILSEAYFTEKKEKTR